VAFSIAQYAALRPTLWHLTHRQNLDLIKKSRFLMPACGLYRAPLDAIRRRRQIGSGLPVLRDQDLLHEECIQLQAGFSFADWVKELNRRVLFWSGWPDRPVRQSAQSVNAEPHI
jgi:hypothetical protein